MILLSFIVLLLSQLYDLEKDVLHLLCWDIFIPPETLEIRSSFRTFMKEGLSCGRALLSLK